jgi:cleavage and polyadenylation specificity factor subunit 1
LCWKEDGAQLTLLAKDFGSLDCYATEFLIDGSTLSLLVSDSRKNLQVYFGISSVTLRFPGPTAETYLA